MSDQTNYNYPQGNPYMKPKKNKTAFWVIFFVLILIVTNLITYFLPRYFPVFSGNSIVINANDEIAVKNINKMLYIYEQLKENYLWELDEEKLWEYAIKGMFEGTGDVYSGYMTADEYSAYAESVSGSYYGIGVRIQNNEDGNVQVVGVFSGSPAEEAGLMSGDVIVSAGDVSLLGVSVDNAVTYIKGEEGTSVTLGVLRNGAELTLEVRRAKIETEYTSYKMLDNGIGYIRIIEFETNAYKQFSEAVTSLKDMGMKGLILDLRQNPGGSVDETIDIADDMLGKCDIIYTLDNKEQKQLYTSDASYTVDVPIVVLIDENSASASEILAVALQDNNAATIVGTVSYGKGIMQTLHPLNDGSMYKYTFCEYYGPNGTKIHGVGITPDIVVEQSAEYANYSIESIPEGADVQLNKAIEVITQKISD